ncbi:MAG: ComEC family competence protein, partial [Hymenobacteraceae bacterium]|nr:ComEC family competence protein [Hymenobacteraceae bacterium]
DDYVVEKEKTVTTTLAVKQILVSGKWMPVTGRSQLTVAHTAGAAVPVKYGNLLLIKGGMQPVKPPANPGAFDFKKFQENRQVYHQHYVQPGQVLVTGHAPGNVLLAVTTTVRNKLDGVFQSFFENPDEKGIAAALVLGVKDYLPQELRQAYANTGTMHVLAVSGLHVGLLFAVLSWLFSRFRFVPGHQYISAVAILLLLWGYAFITGLTPSVLRAVLMFSLVLVATTFRRRTNIYNSVAAAAFLLLAYNPYYLFEVSFQLSFLAVLAIVYLTPRLYNLLEFDNWFADKLWALLAVSVAAQIGTFPLGLYYFHQFPTYFWLANLPVLPLATLVLWSGLALLVFHWVPGVSLLLAYLNQAIVGAMNMFVSFIDQLPFATIPASVTAAQMWLLYGILVAVLLFLAVKRLFYLAVCGLLLFIFSFWQHQEVQQQAAQKQFTVYATKGTSAVSFIQGRQVKLLTDAKATDYEQVLKQVQTHWQQAGLIQFNHNTDTFAVPVAVLPDSNQFVNWNGNRFLFLKKQPQFWPRQPVSVDYLILQQNVRVNLPQVLQHYPAKTVILDTSNRNWYLRKTTQELQKLHVPFYAVSEQGAFVKEF